jgi:hypothetical protein
MENQPLVHEPMILAAKVGHVAEGIPVTAGELQLN